MIPAAPLSHPSPSKFCSHLLPVYAGYQIELFRMAASEVGWAEADFVFTCMDYTVMMADLNNPAGNCTVVATGALGDGWVAEGQGELTKDLEHLM